MARRGNERKISNAGIALAVAAVVAIAGGLIYDNQRTSVSANVGTATMYVPPEPEAVPESVTVDLSVVSKAMFFGDSLTRGVGAIPEQAGFAYLTAAKLGAPPIVWGFGGTGYVNPGPGETGAFQKMFGQIGIFETPDLVVVQGSTNDAAAKPNDIRASANAFVDEIQAKFPRAQVVLVGPELLDLTQRPKLNQVNWGVRQAAIDQDVRFVNTLGNDWFTPENLPIHTALDPTGSILRLTNEGHAYYSDRLMADLQGNPQVTTG